MRIGNSIYLDHHATTPVDPKVLDRMVPYFSESFGNPHSDEHAFGWEASQAVELAASQVASLIGADPDEIVFTSGATEANNLALFGTTHGSGSITRKDILVLSTDHKSTLAACENLCGQGFAVHPLPVRSTGEIDLDILKQALCDKTLLVSLNLVNGELGTIQPISEVSSLVRKAGAFLHLDASQAPCAMETNRLAKSCDLLSLSAHKMYGPKGIGALFVRRSVQNEIQPLILGGGQQQNLRSGTVPTPLCVGFGAAAELLQHADGERLRISKLRNSLLEQLNALPWDVQVNGTMRSRHPGNINVRFHNFSAEHLIGSLQPNLAVSSGSACTSGTPEPSYVLRAIGLDDSQAGSSVRFCVGRRTTERDIADAVTLVHASLERLHAGGLNNN